MSVNRAKGTRDFLPEQMRSRLHVIDVLRRVFTRFGFAPLETPAIERIETLMGKYGEEGDQLIYKILKRGEGGSRGEVDLALRYDLTVPLSRVVAMNPDLPMPFKRYQIQPVWRADRPQKGRFREFYQCDVDIVGCEDMSADAEALAVVNAALRELGFREFTIRLNHRQILRAITEAIGQGDQETAVLVAIDKLDKIGRDGVSAELERRGVPAASIDALWGLIGEAGPAAMDRLEAELGEAGQAGVRELREVTRYAAALGVPEGTILFDPTLARGLSYYTGPVFETEVTEPRVGSISGGGRYDQLIGMFSKRSYPAVGVTLGLERIALVMEELGMLDGARTSTKALVTVFSEDLKPAAMQAASALREAGVPTELWLGGPGKLGKQFKHAGRAGVPWVVTVGPGEAEAGAVQIKDMRSGEQSTLPLAEAAARIQSDAGGGAGA